MHSLWGATADLVWYLGLHAPVSQMIEKLKLMYGTVAFFISCCRTFISYSWQEWIVYQLSYGSVRTSAQAKFWRSPSTPLNEIGERLQTPPTWLIISGLHQYNEDVLFLVVLGHKYGEWVPVQLGTLVIDQLVVIVTSEELQQVWWGMETGALKYCRIKKECSKEPVHPQVWPWRGKGQI